MGMSASGFPPDAGFACAAAPALSHCRRTQVASHGLGQSSSGGHYARPSAASTRQHLAVGAAVVAAAVSGLVAARPRRATLRPRGARRATFGPTPTTTEKQTEVKKSDIGARVAYVVLDNMEGIKRQLQQYGYCQVDGFLGGSAFGYPDQIRKEMKTLFDRGWFETESQEDAQFKVGSYHLENQDRDNRFRMKIQGAKGDDASMTMVEKQFDIAPTVMTFVRSLLVSMSGNLGKTIDSGLADHVATSELFALCGEGARYDRRVGNCFGWHTQTTGFVRDPRKLVAMYFSNPNYKEEQGGCLQLEGVITPTGAVRITPAHDRLVLFWADKTVWSMTRSRASLISEHQYGIIMHLMAKEKEKISYNPMDFARWFPELNGQPMDWPPPGMSFDGPGIMPGITDSS